MRNGRWGGAVPVKESREGISDEAVRLSKEMNVCVGRGADTRSLWSFQSNTCSKLEFNALYNRSAPP